MPKGRNQRTDRFGVLSALLRWEGELRNRRIQKLFGVKFVMASRLITQFAEAYPGMLENDRPRRHWVPTTAALPGPDVGIDDYLAVSGLEQEPEAWFEDARVSFQEPDSRVFATLRRACIERLAVDLIYRSMNHPEGTARRIYPHAIVRLSQRWHVRAWCTLRKDYRDFTLGRIRNAAASTAVEVELPADIAWDQFVDLRIGAHSALSLEQDRTIRDEYFGGAVARRIRVRGALVNYLINDLRISVDAERQAPPEYQLQVLNLPDLRKYLFGQKSD